ncbi:aromatic-ring-hydroxylating dioxygenase subunit beta [Sphingomonas echinoides]|uniref:aromatic-ring-hydroxylating dioxygenase subunit beta n=1 Tax=Sphingomonas echinoides TaxID=59803 RepID=UPI002413A53C|nr:aromatic-ring-hydroxylating dioxygenase subunit beta [Sphingomonas echinoides]
MFENNDQLLPPLPAVVTEPTLEHMLRHFEVEQFLIEEAALLDQGKFQDWLALFAEDVRYWMPIRRTMTTKDTARQFTRPGQMAFIDDDHAMLAMRVRRLKTGYAWAEDPPSRVRRLVTNIRITAATEDEIEVHSNFYTHRVRLEKEEDTWVGHRQDRLRRVDGALKIRQRAIFIESTVLQSPNLSNFF